MSDLNDQIREAIDEYNTARAADLLKEAMENEPNAETYYQAARIAPTDTERAELLRTAVELDPDHDKAQRALENLGTSANAMPPAVAPGTGDENVLDRVGSRLPDAPDVNLNFAPLGINLVEWFFAALGMAFVPAMPIIALVLGDWAGSVLVSLVGLAVAIPLSVGMAWFLTSEVRKRIRMRAQVLSQGSRRYA